MAISECIPFRFHIRWSMCPLWFVHISIYTFSNDTPVISSTDDCISDVCCVPWEWTGCMHEFSRVHTFDLKYCLQLKLFGSEFTVMHIMNYRIDEKWYFWTIDAHIRIYDVVIFTLVLEFLKKVGERETYISQSDTLNCCWLKYTRDNSISDTKYTQNVYTSYHLLVFGFT